VAAEGKTPEILLERGPETTHPLYAWTREDQLLVDLTDERLYEPDGKGGWRSDVVAKATIEGTAVALALQPLDWSDGRPLVAADVCATVQRIRSTDRPTPWTTTVSAHVAGCVADDRDPRVVHLTLTTPRADPSAWLDFPLVPAHRPEWAGAGPQNDLQPVGLGPWSVVEDAAGWHLLGSKRAPEKRLDLVVVPSAAKALEDGRGVVDPFVAPSELPGLRSHPELTVQVEAGHAVWALVLNPTRGPLREVGARAGLDLLIDRDQLASALYGRDPDLAAQPWTAVSGPFLPKPGEVAPVPVTTRDPDAAAAALTEAGLVRTEQGWTWQGQPWSLKVLTPLGIGPDPAKLQAALSEQLDGVRVEVTPLSSTQWWFSLLAGAYAPVADVALVPVDPADLAVTFHARTPTDGLENPFGWSDPQVDAWLGDPSQRDPLAERLADLHPALFLWVVNGRSAWRTPYESLRGAIEIP
jgi:ABC-type transport system substrate-binding protein